MHAHEHAPKISDIDPISTPPRYFAHISITTPIASDLKNYYTYLELSRSPHGFLKPLLDPDDRFASKTDVT